MLVVLLASGGVAAQTFTQATLTDDLFARVDCDDRDDVTLSVRGTVAPGTVPNLRGVLFEELTLDQSGLLQCPGLDDTRFEGEVLFDDEELTRTGTTFTFSRTGEAADWMFVNACDEVGVRFAGGGLCLYLMTSLDQVLAARGVDLAFDTQVPAVPAIEQLSTGDGRISFNVGNVDTELGDVYDFLVQYRPCEAVSADAGPDDTDAGTQGDAGTSVSVSAPSTCGAPGDFLEIVEPGEDVTLSRLQNNVLYELRVLVRDDFGNVSEPSEVVTATPRKGLGPIDFYNGSGSPYSTAPSCGATRGVSVSFAGLIALLGLFCLGRSRRRGPSRARLGAGLSLLIVPVLLMGGPASAQLERDGEVTLSLFAGPYHPAIDSERRNGAAIFPIYDCFFDDATLVEIGGSLDYHLLDVFGSLQLGLGLSATQAKGNSLPPGATQCGEKTEDGVELTILKVTPQLVYRLDPLLDWFGFPLVPYGRVGVTGAAYAFTNNGLFPGAPTDAQNPLGLVLGYEAAGGLMLALDFWDYLDPFSRWGTKRGRASGVFQHAFLYGEAVWQPLDNFGRPSLILSPTEPFTGSGAPWTVHFGVAMELL